MSRDKEYDEYCLKAGIENRNIGTVRLGDLNHMNLIQLEAMVLHHAQQIKDIAAHLLELKQLVTPMMEFKPPTKIFGPNLEQILNAAGFYRKKEWVGLTEDEKYDCYLKIDVWSRCVEAVESKLKEKNGG